MQKRCRIIYNPTSGREAMKNDLVEILNILERAGYETSAFQTTPEPDSARNEAERVARAGFNLVVAAGGDGTINEVVNGIAPLKQRPKMGIIPAGTTNDYARALRIPREDPVAAAKVIAKGQTVNMDIGQAGEKYFVNIAGGGLLTELTYGVPSQFKSLFGYLAYLVKGAEMLPRIKPIKMHLEYDNGIFDGKASMFLLALTNSIGGFEQIVPDASLDDGKFTLIVVKTSNLVEILQLMTMVLNGGRHINDSRILYVKTSKLIAKPVDDKMMINIDGEYGGDAPMVFKNLEQHIQMFANTEKIPKGAITSSDKTPEEIDASQHFVESVEDLIGEDMNGDGTVGKKEKK
ncbi:transcription regulator [Liquorilactobacillus sucicola DSM 21376 = JCM 15457]|uniref:Lipid kinase n=1 Tax=Liquorilactobacillus sucicola DSM 21376 = JCM 15457 TaxID=1423806 RepID=A0A023CZH5_9LACO|nr:diacylglycerol kinase [Liquorilactobacillus sucicola]KRN05797.1 lipid kinase [Liquorilactobacillus sucicola DSM 21376 = JCM 15457]GAJ27272.1 transcription regulator [Liquorilactobacillus sucicola DSM 21376 = JCM 15457]